jgi:predicted RND superfamily exporter protein
LVSTQLESLGVAFVLVFATIGIGLRSWRLMLSAVLPNVLPFASAFAVMALAGLSLDPATVMVASIALGIAVDNTVHQLEVFRSHNRGGLPVPDAVLAARAEVAPAMVTTALTACAGFLALCLSSFLPIRSFGLLSATAVLVALSADMLLVPAKLALLARRGG